MNEIYISPNFDERNAQIEHLILHYTGMKSGQEAIDRLCDANPPAPLAKVSAHYVVEEDGAVYNLVDESKRAWHAGVSYWRGKESLNASSIGIEIVNPGHEFGYREFTEAQYKSIIELCSAIKKRHGLKDINIIGHSDIAPERKEDPGELFDWERLAKAGIGLWPTSQQQGNPAIKQLTDLGYKTHDTASITAFQRHWRQSKVDGVWDEECATILTGLLDMVPKLI